jgi:regulatory protein YycH of two-component signal transduction system YycFG
MGHALQAVTRGLKRSFDYARGLARLDATAPTAQCVRMVRKVLIVIFVVWAVVLGYSLAQQELHSAAKDATPAPAAK